MIFKYTLAVKKWCGNACQWKTDCCHLSANGGSLKREVSSGSPFIIFYSAPECLTKLEISYAPPMPATVIFTFGEESNSLPSALFGSMQCSSSHNMFWCYKRWWKSHGFYSDGQGLSLQNRESQLLVVIKWCVKQNHLIKLIKKAN